MSLTVLSMSRQKPAFSKRADNYRSLQKSYIEALKVRNLLLAEFCEVLTDLRSYEMSWYKNELEKSQETLIKARKMADLVGGYDFAQSIKLQGGTLACGVLQGSSDRIYMNAEKWIKRIPKRKEDCTLYEMGSYICLISHR